MISSINQNSFIHLHIYMCKSYFCSLHFPLPLIASLSPSMKPDNPHYCSTMHRNLILMKKVNNSEQIRCGHIIMTNSLVLSMTFEFIRCFPGYDDWTYCSCTNGSSLGQVPRVTVQWRGDGRHSDISEAEKEQSGQKQFSFVRYQWLVPCRNLLMCI